MRFPDWQIRLQQWLQQAEAREFRYGTYDCALFAAAAVLAITGRNEAEQFEIYRGAREAKRILRRFGSLEGLATSILGDSLPPALARHGDVVVADLTHGATLGVCVGTAAAFPGARGVIYQRIGVVRACWRVD